MFWVYLYLGLVVISIALAVGLFVYKKLDWDWLDEPIPLITDEEVDEFFNNPMKFGKPGTRFGKDD